MDSTAPAWARLVAAVAVGPQPHRLLSGDGPEGPWCGAGDAHPVLGATEARVAVGAAAAALDGHHVVAVDPTTLESDVVVEADLGAAIEAARAGLEAHDGSASARSTLVGVIVPGQPVAAWLGLGPPASAVLVRCWPGIVQGPDATGADGAAAPLAVAAEEAAAALSAGRVDATQLSAALSQARAAAFAEGLLAERHARLMDTAGDDRGGAVRRVVAQAYAVDAALRALRAVTGGGPRASRV